jgi:Tfp pilus assembly protein PilF
VAHNLLGELLTVTRAYPQAIAELTEATQLSPRLGAAYRNLAIAKVGAGDVAGAAAACEAGLKRLPHDVSLSLSLASLYEQQGRVDDAIAQYQSLYAHNPRSEVVANNLAMLLVAHHSDRQSLEQAEKLTTAFAGSDNAAFLDTYGWVRLRAGDLATARTSLERALERSPGSRTIRYHLAMAQLKAGDRDKARSNLERALAGAGAFEGAGDARTALASLGGRSG